MENEYNLTYKYSENVKNRALAPLTNTDEFTTRAFMLTSSLVSRVGDDTAAALLAHTWRYHAVLVSPFLAAGWRIGLHFQPRSFDQWLRNKRAGPHGKAEKVDETDGFTLAICEFSWMVETMLWEGGVVCLRGLGCGGRAEVYFSVLEILEIRWRVQDALPQDLKDVGCGRYTDKVLSEKWCRGLLPDSETAASVEHRMIEAREERQVPVGRSPCIAECRCDDMKIAVYLTPLRSAPAPGSQSEGGVRQGAVFTMPGVLPGDAGFR